MVRAANPLKVNGRTIKVKAKALKNGSKTFNMGSAFTVTSKLNPKKLTFAEVEAASLPRVLDDVDAAVINGNYAIPAGFSASRDGLVVEGADSPYVNVIAVKSGNEKNPAVVALVKALQSDKLKKWVADKYKNGEVVVVF